MAAILSSAHFAYSKMDVQAELAWVTDWAKYQNGILANGQPF